MPDSLIPNPIHYFDSVSTGENLGSKGVRQKSSDSKEIFTISSAGNDSQGTGKSQKTDSLQEASMRNRETSKSNEKKDKERVQKNAETNPATDSPSQVNPLAGALPVPPIELKSEQPDLLKSSDSGNSLVNADMKLKEGDNVQAGKNELAPLTDHFKGMTQEEEVTGGQDKKQSDILTLKGVNGKSDQVSGQASTALEPADKKDLSLSVKTIQGFSVKESGKGQENDEKGSPGESASEKNLSDQNSSSGTFSMIPLDKPLENSGSPSYGLIHQSEGALNRSLLSVNDATPEEKQILRQMTGWLTHTHNNEMQSVRIKLSPETLGTLQIDISVQNQQVKADIVASSQQVKELLEKHQDLLRNGLSDNGLRVDQFTVRLEEPSGYQAGLSMNFQNRFFQREDQPNGHFRGQTEQFTTPFPHSMAVESGGMILENSQSGISIYI